MNCFETHPHVKSNELVVVQRRVVDGEQLGALAPGVEAVPHGDGTEEHPQAEQWAVRDAQRGARHAHGVEVQHGAARPRADAALGAAKLHGLPTLTAGGRCQLTCIITFPQKNQ